MSMTVICVFVSRKQRQNRKGKHMIRSKRWYYGMEVTVTTDLDYKKNDNSLQGAQNCEECTAYEKTKNDRDGDKGVALFSGDHSSKLHSQNAHKKRKRIHIQHGFASAFE